MTTLALIEAGNAIAIAIGLMGLSGCIFTALRFRRDDTTALVSQQDFIVNEMKSLNEELRLSTERLRAECDDCLRKLNRLG